ncbi:MAG: GNAT family N-acetyltransferase [Bacteroidia bacterium]
MESPLEFLDATKTPEVFFSILPKDWQKEIIPHWSNYTSTAKIYVLKQHNKILGGGIVFSTVSPDTMAYKELAQTYFDKGYLYLAFIYVDEKLRGKNLGSIWLQNSLKTYPNQKFWLTIEDISLKSFYEKNGFELTQKISLPDWDEWVIERR